MDKWNDDDDRMESEKRAERNRRGGHGWRGDRDAVETPPHKRQVFPCGSTAAQYIPIVQAWECASAPMSDGAKVRAVNELLRAAHAAGWTRGQLCEWIAERVAKVTAASEATLAELDARAKRKIADANTARGGDV